MTTRIIEGKEAKTMDRKVKWSLLSPFLKQFGSGSMAYSTLQPGMEYFVDDNLGYIAFSRYGKFPFRDKTFVMADPIVEKGETQRLISNFLNRFRKPLFLQSGEHTRDILRAEGFSCTQMGIETDVDAKRFDLQGEKKQILRTARNKAARDGLSTIEVENEKDYVGLKEVSDRWLASRSLSDREIWYFARPALMEDEPDVRKMIALNREGRKIGFIFFDPTYSRGKVTGYCANIARFSPTEFKQGINDVILLSMLEKLKEEEPSTLHLGLSPFHALEEELGQTEKSSVKGLFKFLYKRGNKIYNFKNIGFHKERYCGTQKPVYFCSRSSLQPLEVYLSMNNAGMLSSIGEMLRKTMK